MASAFKYEVIKGGKVCAEATTKAEATAEAARCGGKVKAKRSRNPSGAKQRVRGTRRYGQVRHPGTGYWMEEYSGPTTAETITASRRELGEMKKAGHKLDLRGAFARDLALYRNPATRNPKASTRISKMRKIVAEHKAAKVEKLTIDAYTASLYVQVYDALNAANKAKLEAAPIFTAVILVYKLAAQRNPSQRHNRNPSPEVHAKAAEQDLRIARTLLAGMMRPELTRSAKQRLAVDAMCAASKAYREASYAGGSEGGFSAQIQEAAELYDQASAIFRELVPNPRQVEITVPTAAEAGEFVGKYGKKAFRGLVSAGRGLASFVRSARTSAKANPASKRKRNPSLPIIVEVVDENQNAVSSYVLRGAKASTAAQARAAAVAEGRRPRDILSAHEGISGFHHTYGKQGFIVTVYYDPMMGK